jgi:hypothetical protein
MLWLVGQMREALEFSGRRKLFAIQDSDDAPTAERAVQGGTDCASSRCKFAIREFDALASRVLRVGGNSNNEYLGAGVACDTRNQ